MDNLDRFLALLEYLKIKYYSYCNENNIYIYMYKLYFEEGNYYYSEIIEISFIKIMSETEETYEIKDFKKFDDSIVIDKREKLWIEFNELDSKPDEFIDFIENEKKYKKYKKRDSYIKVKGDKYQKENTVLVKCLSYLIRCNIIENYYFYCDYEYGEDYMDWMGYNVYFSKKNNDKLDIFRFIFQDGCCRNFEIYESKYNNLGEAIKDIEFQYGEQILYKNL